MKELPKTYNAKEIEDDIYKQWEQSGFFNPDNLQGDPYTIIMPPANVTGTLHIGHALTFTIEDILTRWHRMLGRKTLWLPGTDHAAIATQTKVEKLIQKEEKKNRHDLGREEFLKRVETFAQESHDTIISQLKKMGASCDWTREAFTLDKARNEAINTAFKKLYDLGLIYRGYRVINWDVRGQTTVSDDELVYIERPAKLYTFKYSRDFPIAISTTRPETKLGDTGVAVHPDDKRYKQYIGKEYSINFCGVELNIKIVADPEVDPEFGTGAVGVTPAHSMIDFEIAKRHDLPLKPIINEFGKITVDSPEFKNTKTTDAREMIVKKLKDEGLMEKEEDTTHNVATAERSGGVIEPLPKLQWFIDVNKEFLIHHSEIDGIKTGDKVTLKQLMRHAVESGQIKIVPDHFAKTYFHWIDGLKDWCISRQIWYGHRIPAWYKDNDTKIGEDDPGNGWTQDPDTLDTWFSSGLWTFSTLGWPKQTNDFETFHPTDVMETGYDIIFFWVARMILMTTALTGQIPFRTVFLHGMVRDENKNKMSKSKGNVIDPLEMTEKYGTDALRFSLVFNTAPGTDMALSEDKIKGMKHFANKLWNVCRFIMMNLTENFQVPAIIPEAKTDPDKDILNKLNQVIRSTNEHLQNFRLHEAAQIIYDFIWHEFADIYIEKSKTQLENDETSKNTQDILLYTMITTLKLIHPFMPFVTEHIWSLLTKEKEKNELLLIQKYPQPKQKTTS